MFLDIDECESCPCQNCGTCMDEVNGFMCECEDGFTGLECETGNKYASVIHCVLLNYNTLIHVFHSFSSSIWVCILFVVITQTISHNIMHINGLLK